MSENPNVVRVAALIGDHARAAMLTALMAGEALTATELAAAANVTKQTASSHLAKLLDAGLIALQTQGRHRYFALAAPDVAQLLENLMGVAQRIGAGSAKIRFGPREPLLRKARVCYDHLAGELGVALFDTFQRQGFIDYTATADNHSTLLALTDHGKAFCRELGVDIEPVSGSRRPLSRSCLDWSVRRHHLAGTLGAALLNYCYQRRWAKRQPESRIVRFSASGERAFRDTFGI